MSQEMSASPMTCFIIGPIGSELAELGTPDRLRYEESLKVLELVIKPACKSVGLSPVRADELARAGEMTEQIFRRLREDDIVIADLTDANPNVMYELGLRHTRRKLTIQIGEYGRLPFDVNVIRTVQFAGSDYGLIKARDELIGLLQAGMIGDYDHVTATRVWNESDPPGEGVRLSDGEPEPPPSPAEGVEPKPPELADAGFVDILADAEQHSEDFTPAIERVSGFMVELGNLAEKYQARTEESDAAGNGMRGKLLVLTAFANELTALAEPFDAAVDEYITALNGVSAGNLYLIGEMERGPEVLAQGSEFGTTIRGLANTTRSAMAGLGLMSNSISATGRNSRVLKEPTRRISTTLGKFASATSVMDEWDRRLQALGIPAPPHEEEESEGDDGEDDEG